MSGLVLGTGAGFIGHHLVKNLVRRGYWVRGVDVKPPEFEFTHAHEFLCLDLRERESTLEATEGVVGGPNSDNSLLRNVLGWEPRMPLEEGPERTYRWIEGDLRGLGLLG